MKFFSRVVTAAAVALALSALAASAATSVATPAKPSRPSSLTAAAGDTRVTLRWAPPTLRTPPIDHYTVTRNPGAVLYQTSDPSTTLVVPGLTNLTTYTFTVTATNTLGTGPASTPATAKPHISPPGRPTNLTATQGPSAGQITISWTPPTTTGSMPDGSAATITHYLVSVSSGIVNQQLDPSTTTFTASNLADNVTYDFAVSDTNSRGLGSAAAVVYSPVPTGATIGLAPTAGLATASITVTGQGFLKNESLTLYWDISSHVAASVVTDDNGAFTKVVKPFAGSTPKIHKLCASVQPGPCATFTLRAPPTPTPSQSPSPNGSPSPSGTPQASGTRVSGGGGGGAGVSGLDFITKPPFVFLPIIGILGLLGVIAYWVLSSRRRPMAPSSASVVHLATRPDYMAPFPGAVPPAAAPIAAPPPPTPAPQPAPAPAEPPPLPMQQAPPLAGPPVGRPPAWPPPTPPAPIEAPPPPNWPAAPDEPPDLPQPSD